MNTLPWHLDALSKLQKMIKQNHLPHALLISGEKHIGKFELMQQLVGILINNDTIIRKDNAKEDVDFPVLIRRSNYINMVYCRANEVQPKINTRSKKIRLAQIIEFCDILNKTADKLQIGVIFYADQMNANASNALLKTLEEPRENTLIIILAHHYQSLPITIRSRCQHVRIVPSYNQQTHNWLKSNINTAGHQNIDVKILLENAYGVPFKVLSELSKDNLTANQNYQKQLLAMAVNPLLINQVKGFENNEVRVLKCLQNLIIKAIRLKFTQQKDGLIELNQLTHSTNSEFLFKLLDDVYRAINLSKTSINIKLLLDNVLIVWSHISHMKHYPTITSNY